MKILLQILLVALPLGAQDLFNEARTKANEYWRTRFTSCAQNEVTMDTWHSGYKVYRGVEWSVTPINLTDADRLNGMRWKGSSRMVAGAFRSWYPKLGWSQWNGLGNAFTI